MSIREKIEKIVDDMFGADGHYGEIVFLAGILVSVIILTVILIKNKKNNKKSKNNI